MNYLQFYYLLIISSSFLNLDNNTRFFLSGAEVIAAAEQQLEAAGGIEDTPFVTITVTIAHDDQTKRVVSAYQVKLFHFFMKAVSADP